MSEIKKNRAPLEQVLRRSDTWRGNSRDLVKQSTVASGYCELDNALQQHGWPLACLIEVYQNYHASEWSLFHHAINTLIDEQKQGHIALINPPALPFLHGLAQLNIPYNKMLIAQPKNTEELIKCFSELSHASSCCVIFSWQQNFPFNYTQLRKLQLKTTKQDGLYVLFRHTQSQYHNSPASLRIISQPQEHSLDIHILKQRGKRQHCNIQLPIPTSWQKLLPHKYLQSGINEQKKIQYTVPSKHQITLLPRIKTMETKTAETKELKGDYN